MTYLKVNKYIHALIIQINVNFYGIKVACVGLYTGTNLVYMAFPGVLRHQAVYKV